MIKRSKEWWLSRAASEPDVPIGAGVPCAHESFHCQANVTRLSSVEDGPITGYTVGIEITCTECGIPFRFIGLPAGNSFQQPMVSIDGTELRAPLEPAAHQKFHPRADYTMPPRNRQ